MHDAGLLGDSPRQSDMTLRPSYTPALQMPWLQKPSNHTIGSTTTLPEKSFGRRLNQKPSIVC